MATIYDVARRARVSTYTVSAVLNRSAYVSPELTQRVRLAVSELDYTINEVARSLQTRRTKTIGMLIPDIGNPFFAKVVRGVESRLHREGYSLILGCHYDQLAEQSRYLALFRAKQMDGILVFVAAGEDRELDRLLESRRPVVFAGRVPSGIDADSVTADNILGTRLAVEHLIACGHKRIALLLGPRQISPTEDRITSWRQILRKRRLAAPEEYIGSGDWTTESSFGLTSQLLELPEPPTALFAGNFLMMAGAVRALKEKGIRCPAEVQVASSDDFDWLDAFEPAVTTVVQPSFEIGEKAAELLLKRIASPKRKTQKIVLEATLRIR
jgi:LacI family transcriptional regulator